MDERQRQIREQAGLDESKVNEELIDFLRKWGTPILLIIALASVAYAANAHFKQRANDKMEEAFAELAAAAGSQTPSPESLRRLAEDYDGVRAVGVLARLTAADIHLATLRTGLKPGASPKPDGSHDAGDLVTPDERALYLTQARELYQKVVELSSGKPGRDTLHLNGLYGLAAVEECAGSFDRAREIYGMLAGVAERAGFAAHAGLARKRLGDLESLANAPALLSQSQLPALPTPPAPPVPTPPAGPEVPPAAPAPEPTTPPAPPPSV
ncbi:MAG: hypothetical protein FJ255_09990 [Phycisphaerae bacterium]|nr:hypothetical protein [Phycisphaerae bacterium]